MITGKCQIRITSWVITCVVEDPRRLPKLTKNIRILSRITETRGETQAKTSEGFQRFSKPTRGRELNSPTRLKVSFLYFVFGENVFLFTPINCERQDVIPVSHHMGSVADDPRRLPRITEEHPNSFESYRSTSENFRCSREESRRFPKRTRRFPLSDHNNLTYVKSLLTKLI